MYNKGSAFTYEERERFGLDGLLPPRMSSPEVQLDRAYANIVRSDEPLQQYIALAALQDRNETLFYKIILRHLEKFAPVVYTPTVGLACQEYSHIFRRGRGLWITPLHKGKIANLLDNAPYDDVALIVVTDNERILGLGDQGAGGMGIPIGKLVLYTVGAGIHPTRVLPISLDVGTDNEALLEDPLYIGYRKPRLRGAEYDALVDEFIQAVKIRFPSALLQWEDFKKATAFTLLDRYRTELLSFNDDIQGTAAVALSGVMAAMRITDIPITEQRVVILGAGAAGIGIGRQLRDAMSAGGLRGDELTAAVAVLDSRGLLVDSRDFRDDYKREFAWPAALAEQKGLLGSSGLADVVGTVKPTVLIGTSGQPGTFTEDVVRMMAAHVDRPVIFPFSNPTSKCEAVPADLIAWTEGRALVASGSPFDPVCYGDRTIRIGQGNNVYIFPGVGLGALVAKATEVTESMFTIAAKTLASEVGADDLAECALYPPLRELRQITARIAGAVALEAVRQGVAPTATAHEVAERVEEAMWQPEYIRFVKS
jgi:malate dehydrogenase (oxaloacetate-decarboxylating)